MTGAVSPVPEHTPAVSKQCPVPTCVTACSRNREPRQSKGLALTKGKMADPPARSATGANGVILAGVHCQHSTNTVKCLALAAMSAASISFSDGAVL